MEEALLDEARSTALRDEVIFVRAWMPQKTKTATKKDNHGSVPDLCRLIGFMFPPILSINSSGWPYHAGYSIWRREERDRSDQGIFVRKAESFLASGRHSTGMARLWRFQTGSYFVSPDNWPAILKTNFGLFIR
jgi:hypothetical protein